MIQEYMDTVHRLDSLVDYMIDNPTEVWDFGSKCPDAAPFSNPDILKRNLNCLIVSNDNFISSKAHLNNSNYLDIMQTDYIEKYMIHLAITLSEDNYTNIDHFLNI